MSRKNSYPEKAMIKMKDAFRRIGPTSSLKRKDSAEVLKQNINGDIFAKSMDENDLKILRDGIQDDLLKNMNIPGSISLPQIKDIFEEETEGDGKAASESTDAPRVRKNPIRKNSSSRTRSAENIAALIDQETDEILDQVDGKNRRRGDKKRSKVKRKILAQSYEPNKLLEKAIEEGYADLVENLIASGQININKLNSYGFAPLHLAAFEGKVDVVEAIINQGAYIDILTKTGMSALEVAVVEGNFDCAQTLIENGADQGFVLDGR